MDQDNPNRGSGFGNSSGSDFGSAGTGSTGSMGSPGTGSGFGAAGTSTGATRSGSDVESCAHCGTPLHGSQHSGLEQLLGKIGISDDVVRSLKGSMENIDVDEYLNTAREYLKGGSSKTVNFAKNNSGKIAAGVAVLAVGAGLLIASLRDRDDDTARIDVIRDEGDAPRL